MKVSRLQTYLICFYWIRHVIKALLILLIAAAFACVEDDPLAVDRTDAVYKSVLTDSLIERRVTSWYHGFYLKNLPEDIRKLYTAEIWTEEQSNFLTETGSAGMEGPFAGWSLRELGESGLNDMYTRYGMMFPYYAHHSGHFKPSRDAGAAFVLSGGQVACWDKHYIEVASTATEKWLEKYGKSPWLSAVIGRDEPLNYAAAIRYPAVVDKVNSILKERYNLTLQLSPGDPDKPWYEWPTDPAIQGKSLHDIALLRIAVWRWLNEQLYEAARREHELVRRYAPGKLHEAYNRNAINIRDIINKDVSHSLDFLDQSIIYDVTDCFSADPYPTCNLDRDGRARALYHVGFISKFITDLAAGKPSKIIMQGFKFHGRMPTRENLREWVSQAAKAGVTHLEWYTAGYPRFVWPEVYPEMLRLSRLWKDLPALAIPDTSQIAIIFSDDSRAAVNDAGMHALYMLHVLLGEKLGAWFTFVGENHVRRGLQTLDDAKLIIVPQISYISEEFSERLIDRVENGATIVILDPEALTHDIETGPLTSYRMYLMGAHKGESREASSLFPTHEGSERFKGIDVLPLYQTKHGVIARTQNVPAGARILFVYEDSTPAVFSRPLGKGEVIVFGAMPFGNSELALTPSGWDILFAVLIDELSIERGLPIWRFLMPATGGEVKMFEPLVKFYE